MPKKKQELGKVETSRSQRNLEVTLKSSPGGHSAKLATSGEKLIKEEKFRENEGENSSCSPGKKKNRRRKRWGVYIPERRLSIEPRTCC